MQESICPASLPTLRKFAIRVTFRAYFSCAGYAGYSLRGSYAHQVPRVLSGGSRIAGAGHRRQYRRLFAHQSASSAAAAGEESAGTGSADKPRIELREQYRFEFSVVSDVHRYPRPKPGL